MRTTASPDGIRARPFRLLILLTTLMALPAAALVSCDNDEEKCQSIATKPTGKERIYDIVYDGTADAVRGDLPVKLQQSIREAAARPDLFAGGAVEGSAGSDFWQFSGYTAHPRSDTESRRARLAGSLADCVGERVGMLRSRTPNSNILAALQRAGEHIAGSPGPATLAVVSNGLDNVAPLDMRDLVAKGVSPDEIVRQLRAQRQMPELTGAIVTFYGLGYPKSELPLAKPYRDWVTGVWLAICREAGAKKCYSEPGPDASGPSVDAPPDAPFPALPVGAVTAAPEHPVIGDAMFQPGSAWLTPDADALLRPVLTWLAAPGHTARVIGHSASWGSSEYRRRISIDRALAVARRLTTLGADPRLISTDGVGSADAVEQDVDPASGDLIPEAAIRNRRVEIFLDEVR